MLFLKSTVKYFLLLQITAVPFGVQWLKSNPNVQFSFSCLNSHTKGYFYKGFLSNSHGVHFGLDLAPSNVGLSVQIEIGGKI